MVNIANLLKGYKSFYKKYFIEQPQTYQDLVENGQSPKTLVIACSDSRVDPSIIMDTKPGDIFVIRNVANLVPPYEVENRKYDGTSAAIEYAVRRLKVENIIILGHSHCGGINALIEDEKNDHSFMDNWLYIASDAKEISIKKYQDKEKICKCCEKEAIRISMRNIMTFPFVNEAVEASFLQVHGWYFSLQKGSIEIIGG